MPVGESAGLQGFKLDEQLVYFRPDGVRYRLHAPPSRIIVSEEGFGTPPMQYIVDEAPFQHGDTVREFRLKPRPVQLVVMYNFCSRDDYWNGRASLLDALRPNRVTDNSKPGYLRYYLSNGQQRQLDVWLEQGPAYAPRQPGGYRERFFTEAIRFVAHDPVWYDPAQKTTAFNPASAVGAFTFPITFPVTFGTFGGAAAVTYNGTWLEYPTIVITGPITNPRIENTETSQKITLSYTVDAGRGVTITLRGTKTILRDDGVNLLNYLTSDSDLATFALQPDPIAPGGINHITADGDGTTNASTVTMKWYNRYFGI